MSFISSFLGGYGSNDWMSGLYSNLSEYNSIKSGNYYQLTRKYFSEFGDSSASRSSLSKASSNYDILEQIRNKYTDDRTDATTDSDKTSETTKSAGSSTLTKYEQQKLKANQDAATSSKALTSSLNTLMNKKTYETSDTVTDDKVRENVASDLEQFAKDYNGMVDASKKSTATGVSSATKYLMNLTSNYSLRLDEIGITVGNDGKLSVNSDTVKNTDTDKVRELFSDGGSYGTGASTYSTLIGYYANSAVSNGTYTAGGSYYTSQASSYNGFA